MKQSHKKESVNVKIHTHPKEGHWKFQGALGVSKAKMFKVKYEVKLEFLEG